MDDDVKGLFGQQSALALLDHIIGEADQLFANFDRDEKVQTTVGFVATCAVSQLTHISLVHIKHCGTAPLQALDSAMIEVPMQQAAAESRSRTLVKQSLGADVWGLINNTLLAKSIFLDFQAKGVSRRHGLVYAENVSKGLFKKIDGYIQRYAAAGPDELKAIGIDRAVRMVDSSTSPARTPAQTPREVSRDGSSNHSKLAVEGGNSGVQSERNENDSRPLWHLLREGVQYTPISHSEFLAWVQSGNLRSDDLLWKPGFDTWQPANAIPGLQEVPPSESPEPERITPPSIEAQVAIKPSMDRVLTVFIRVWVAIAIAINSAAILAFMLGSENQSEAWQRITETYSPFNVLNYVMELFLFSPAIGAYAWRERRRRGIAAGFS